MCQKRTTKCPKSVRKTVFGKSGAWITTSLSELQRSIESSWIIEKGFELESVSGHPGAILRDWEIILGSLRVQSSAFYTELKFSILSGESSAGGVWVVNIRIERVQSQLVQKKRPLENYFVIRALETGRESRNRSIAWSADLFVRSFRGSWAGETEGNNWSTSIESLHELLQQVGEYGDNGLKRQRDIRSVLFEWCDWTLFQRQALPDSIHDGSE